MALLGLEELSRDEAQLMNYYDVVVAEIRTCRCSGGSDVELERW